MKKKCSIFLLVIFYLFSINANAIVVKAENNTYARITSSNTFLYSTPNFEEENKLFLLEKTYFVKIISSYTNYLKVKYFNVSGYVISSEVEIVNGIPSKPFPENITFNINSSLNTKIRTSTTMNTENNIIGLLPNSNCKLNYIALTFGEESIKNLGNKWYYCYYIYENNSCVYGYVYAPLTENLTQIIPNLETFSVSSELSEEQIPQDISQKQNILIVFLLCLPSVIILILLVLPFKKKDKTNNNSSPKKINRKSKKDFYEVD